MTTRNIALAVDDTVIPEIHTTLAAHGVHLGDPTIIDGVHCYNAHTPTAPHDLSTQDLTILHALADGTPHKQIAALLGITWGTSRRRARRLYRKLGARGKCDAVAIAYRIGALNSWEAAA